MTVNTLAISLTIPAPRIEVWKAIADWPSQGEWMLQTKVWVTSERTSGVGTSIAAFTGPLREHIFPVYLNAHITDSSIMPVVIIK